MDTNKIKQIIELFEESNISSMDLEVDEIKIKLEKQEKEIHSQKEAMHLVEEKHEDAKVTENIELPKNYIKSPLVGTYYASNTPNGKPFVSVGSKVNAGDIICIIEAMKVMNEIKAPCSGIVKEICMNDGDLVEFDANLMDIEEA